MSKEYYEDLQINECKIEIINMEELERREGLGFKYVDIMEVPDYMIFETQKTGLDWLIAKLTKKPMYKGYIAVKILSEEEMEEYKQERQLRIDKAAKIALEEDMARNPHAKKYAAIRKEKLDRMYRNMYGPKNNSNDDYEEDESNEDWDFLMWAHSDDNDDNDDEYRFGSRK